jgi:hypothetical protein
MDMERATTPEESLVYLQRSHSAFADQNPSSLNNEAWLSFQKQSAAGGRANPTTFGTQTCHAVKENVCKRWEDETGEDLKTPISDSNLIKRASERRKHARPTKVGNPKFLLRADMYKESGVNPIWGDVVNKWDNELTIHEQNQYCQKAEALRDKKVADLDDLGQDGRHRDPTELRGPWKLGTILPITVELLQRVIYPFSSRISG